MRKVVQDYIYQVEERFYGRNFELLDRVLDAVDLYTVDNLQEILEITEPEYIRKHVGDFIQKMKAHKTLFLDTPYLQSYIEMIIEELIGVMIWQPNTNRE